MSTLKEVAKRAKNRLTYLAKLKSENKLKKNQTKLCMSQGDYRLIIICQEIENDPVYKKIKKFQDEKRSFCVSDLFDKRKINNLSEGERVLYESNIKRRYEDAMEYIESQKRSASY